MSDPAYITRLGPNLYLDSHGVLHQGVIPPVPDYTLPGGLFRTAQEVAKLAKTFNDIDNALPDKDEGEKYEKFLEKITKLGLPPELAKLLGVVGNIAGAIGTAFVVLGVAVGLAKMLGMFGDGPSPLELLVKARLDALEKQINELSKRLFEQNLTQSQAELEAARRRVKEFVAQRDSGTMSDSAILSELLGVKLLLTSPTTPKVLIMTNKMTYRLAFDTGRHTKVWPWITNHLFLIPEGKEPVRAVFPTMNSSVFESCIALPLGVQAVQTYLPLIQSLCPEFRTTGDFREHLRAVTENISALAKTIRDETLARTIHHEGDFGWLIPDFYVLDPVPGLTTPTLKPDFTLVVGALDLSNHNDAFFPDVGPGAAVPFPGSSRRGSLEFRWHPPATLRLDHSSSGMVHRDGTPVLNYLITNGRQCADAANELAAQDYADLLLSSGYMTLVHLASQLRHATTEPIHSESVRGNVYLNRHPEARTQVTVHSKPSLALFPKATADLQAQAWREPQTVNAIASVTTQPLPRTKLIPYRILLRTLSSAIPPDAWNEPNYESVQTARHVDDPLNKGFKRLRLETSKAAVLHEEVLFEGVSDDEFRSFDKPLSFEAHTFDWWIPTQPGPFSSTTLDDPGGSALLGREPGTIKPSPVFPSTLLEVKPVMRDSIDTTLGGRSFVMLGHGWEEGAQTWKGFHREMKLATVEMRVRAEWRNSQLRVSIDNRLEDRNYIVFLVVEETFGFIEPDETPPKVLHTAFPMAINGCLTYVPQSLFDEEKKARGKRDEFVHEFGVFVRPKPGEPVFRSITLAELATDAGRERLAAELQQFEPDLLTRFLADRKLPSALSGVGPEVGTGSE
jgi:hypothetical protein